MKLTEELSGIHEEFLMNVDTNINIDSVILSNENKEKVNVFIKENNYRFELIKNKLLPVNKLLFYGASGTGKTLLGKALSNYFSYTMMYVDVAKALSENTVAKNISDVFKLAKHIKTAIVFFDECDSIAWNRDSDNADGGIIRRATNSIFQQLDQMDVSSVFIAATNMINKLDPAFERRFDLKLEFRRPNVNIKDIMEHFIFDQFSLIFDVDINDYNIIERRVNQNVKLSYYELENIAHRAMKRSVVDGSLKCKMSEILRDISLAMNIKIKFRTDIEEEKYYESSIK